MSRVLRAKRQNILDIPSEILFCLILEESNIFFLFKKERFLFCFVLTVFNELMSDALPLTLLRVGKKVLFPIIRSDLLNCGGF